MPHQDVPAAFLRLALNPLEVSIIKLWGHPLAALRRQEAGRFPGQKSPLSPEIRLQTVAVPPETVSPDRPAGRQPPKRAEEADRLVAAPRPGDGCRLAAAGRRTHVQ